MNTTEKVSATERKYAKYLGKLFWERDSTWNRETDKYDITYSLCMVTGLARGRYNLRFSFNVLPLEGEDKSERRLAASRFAGDVNRNYFIPLDKANPVRPASYQADSWRG